jgi:hypothetical protein
MKHHFRRIGSAALLSALCLGTLASSSSAQVDHARKISMDTNGSQLLLGIADLFGYSCCSPGDINNDGVPDIVVGCPRDDDGGSDKGGIRVLFLDRSGDVIAGQTISDLLGGFLGSILSVDLFGAAVGGIGDINLDNVEDIVVGMPGANDGSTDAGAAYLLHLKTDGEVNSYKKLGNGSSGIPLGSFAAGDAFGSAVSELGDLNGDGIVDIVIGAPGDDDGLDFENGAVWILNMNSSSTVDTISKISNFSGGMSSVLPGYGNFGASVTNMGDLNGDGFVDIAVGAPRDDGGGPNQGAVWILFLHSGGFTTGYQKIAPGKGGFYGVLYDDDRFGASVAAIGDLDEDGVIDLAVGAPGSDDAGASSGGLWILYMNSDGTVKDSLRVRSDEPPFAGEIDPLDFLGTSVGAIPDFNGDGIIDLMAGAIGDDDGGMEKGAMYLMRLLPEPITASAVVRNGAGVNPLTFSSLTLPLLGATWDTEVGLPGATAFSSFIYGYSMSADGIMLQWGELLLGIEYFGGHLLFTDVALGSAGIASHSKAIPNDISLEGAVVYTQAMTYGTEMLLTNAIDLTLGFH